MKRVRNQIIGGCVALFVALTLSPAFANSPNRNLPNTSALERDLDDAQRSLQSTISRANRLRASARNLRNEARSTENTLKTINAIESQVGGILRQLETVSRIPQLRVLKPVVRGLKEVKKQVGAVRVRSDRFRREVLQPIQQKCKKFEAKINRLNAKLATLNQSVSQAKSNVVQLRQFVQQRGMNYGEVQALEQIASSARPAFHPIKQILREIDSAGGSVEGDLNSVHAQLKQITRLKSGVDRLQRDLAPIAKKANDLNRVLNKSVSFKIPFGKRVSVSVRKVIESPGKVIDIALKPLQKIANKALQPVIGKFKVNIKVPRELSQMVSQMNNFRSGSLNSLRNVEQKFDSVLSSNSMRQFENSIRKLASTSTSSITRR